MKEWKNHTWLYSVHELFLSFSLYLLWTCAYAVAFVYNIISLIIVYMFVRVPRVTGRSISKRIRNAVRVISEDRKISIYLIYQRQYLIWITMFATVWASLTLLTMGSRLNHEASPLEYCTRHVNATRVYYKCTLCIDHDRQRKQNIDLCRSPLSVPYEGSIVKIITEVELMPTVARREEGRREREGRMS